MKTPFSVGIVRVGPVGATLNDTHNVANIQSVNQSAAFQQALIRAGASISNFPVADAQFDAEFGFTFETTSFPHQLLQYIMGVVGVPGGGKTTYTGTLTAKPQYCQAEYIVTDQDGKKVRVNIPKCKSTQFSPSHNRTDFAKAPIAVMSLPGDPADGIAPYIIEVDN